MDGEVRQFFDNYGEREWNRHEVSTYSRINYLLHMHFIEKYLHSGIRILDAGCGAGRFSIEFAKHGCQVTLFDISDEQLRIAKEKVIKTGLTSYVDGFYQGDIRYLSLFGDEHFDIVVCYGAPLSYVIENREKAISEFYRILKYGGQLFTSVNNKWGIFKALLGNRQPDFFNNPEYWYINSVIKTGDLPRHEKVNHPPRHFFESEELKRLLNNSEFKDIFLGGSPCLCCGHNEQIEELGKDEKALNTIIEIEIETYTKPTMVDNGEFLLARGIK